MIALLIFSGLLLSSCSFIKPLYDSERTHTNKKDTSNLCAYREEKGIVELVTIDKKLFYFKFYPGDETVPVNQGLVPNANTLRIGDELKATKSLLVNGDKFKCTQIELIF